MKSMRLTVLCLVTLLLAPWSLRAWTVIDTSQVPALPIDSVADAVRQINSLVHNNGRNFPPAFLMANVGAMPIGTGTLGGTPHFFIGVAGSVGCANLKYYDEKILRTQGVYPAYAPNPVVYMGVGMPWGLDLMGKFLVFTGTWYKPTFINSKKIDYVNMTYNELMSLSKMNITSAGLRLRKNILAPRPIFPRLLGFGGLTIVGGWDYMEGIVAISGFYKYTLSNLTVTPPGITTNVRLDAWYNANAKWLAHSFSLQSLIYFDLLRFFSLYTGVGMALNHGFVKLDISAIGTATELTTNTALGSLYAANRTKFITRLFMGLFTAGVEIKILWIKINAETMVNISNGTDINFTLGTRFQY